MSVPLSREEIDVKLSEIKNGAVNLSSWNRGPTPNDPDWMFPRDENIKKDKRGSISQDDTRSVLRGRNVGSVLGGFTGHHSKHSVANEDWFTRDIHERREEANGGTNNNLVKKVSLSDDAASEATTVVVKRVVELNKISRKPINAVGGFTGGEKFTPNNDDHFLKWRKRQESGDGEIDGTVQLEHHRSDTGNKCTSKKGTDFANSFDKKHNC